MKCFKVFNGEFSRGLSIRATGDERPHISISAGESDAGEKLPLADSLVEKLHDPARGCLFKDLKTEIVACDLDERGQLWLVEETEATKDELLVYVAELHWVGKKQQGSINCSFSREGCDVLMRTDKAPELTAQFREWLNFAGQAILVRLKPGGWVLVVDKTLTLRSRLSPARICGNPHKSSISAYRVRYEDLVGADSGELTKVSADA